MKNIIIILLISSIILLFGCSIKTSTAINNQYKVNIPASAGNSSVSFGLSQPMPEFPDKMQVYKILKPEVTAEYVSDLGAKLGLKGEIKKVYNDTAFEMFDNDTNVALTIYIETGAIEYGFKIIQPPLEAPKLPSSEEAVIIATNYLTQAGLLPANVKVSSTGIGEKYGDVAQQIYVTFDYQVDGKISTGPGKKYTVRIGDGGKIVRMLLNPIKYEPFDAVSIKPVKQAYEELQTEKKYAVPMNAKRVEINNVTTACWLETINVPQKYIVPVYVFSGQCFDDTGKLMEDKFNWCVEAVD